MRITRTICGVAAAALMLGTTSMMAAAASPSVAADAITVTIHGSTVYGSYPDVMGTPSGTPSGCSFGVDCTGVAWTGMDASNPAITYTPAPIAPVTGSITCLSTGSQGGGASTSAANGGPGNPKSANVGSYAISDGTVAGACTNTLSDVTGDTFTIDEAPANSADAVTQAPTLTVTNSGNLAAVVNGVVVLWSISGLTNGDGKNSLTTQPTCPGLSIFGQVPSASKTFVRSLHGKYPVSQCGGAADANYVGFSYSGSITPSCGATPVQCVTVTAGFTKGIYSGPVGAFKTGVMQKIGLRITNQTGTIGDSYAVIPAPGTTAVAVFQLGSKSVACAVLTNANGVGSCTVKMPKGKGFGTVTVDNTGNDDYMASTNDHGANSWVLSAAPPLRVSSRTVQQIHFVK